MKHLFIHQNLSDVLLSKHIELDNEILNLTQDYLLKVDKEELIEHLILKFKIEPLELDLDNTTIDQKEIDTDISQDMRRSIRDRSRPYYIKGSRIEYYVPFKGDKILFDCRATNSSSLLPDGIVKDTEIIIQFDENSYVNGKINDAFNGKISMIQKFINWVNNDLINYNNTLEDKIRQRISERMDKILKNLSVVNETGFPLRKRENITQSYSVHQIRKTLSPILPKPKYKNEPPEPTLHENQYNEILETISNMSISMERSPKTFQKLNEEEIRDHILMALNINYEGAATGETFNYEGKTDILIRVNNKNIFIAECKFWNGKKSLIKTLDQLLGYISWRDTKTSIILFVKNKSFSEVLNQITETVRSHSNFIKEIEENEETKFKFIISQREDKNRHIFLTILAFKVPTI